MIHNPGNVVAAAPSDSKLRGLSGGMSVFTMIMTVPQVGVRILFRRFSGCCLESKGVTGIFICHAWVGLFWMAQ